MDFEKEKEEFVNELKDGKFSIEYLPNSSVDYETLENRDMEAFDEHLKSKEFKTLVDEVFK